MGIKKVQNNITVTPTGRIGFIREFRRTSDGTAFRVARVLGRAVLKTDDGEACRAQVQIDVGLTREGLAPEILGLTASRQACGAAGIDTSRWDEGIVGVVVLPKGKSFALAMASASEFEGKDNTHGVDIRVFTEDITLADTVTPEFKGAEATPDILAGLASEMSESAGRRGASSAATVTAVAV